MPSQVVALAKSTHPGPTVGVTLMAVALGVAVGLTDWRLFLVGAVFLCNQVSIGLSNDWLDAERDRATGRLDKPVALGLVTVQTARLAALVTAGLSVLLTLPLGFWAAIAHAVFLVSAWSYNLGLKSTVISVLPYIVSFGLLPLVVTLSRADPAPAAAWAMAMGALLGVAAHFANVLPDLDDDRQTGVRGLPHRIGGRACGLVVCGSLAAASVIGAFAPAGAPTAVQFVGLALTVAIAVSVFALVVTRPPNRRLFQLIIVAALLNIALLLVSGDQLLS